MPAFHALTSLFPSFPNYLLSYPPPTGHRTQQFQLGHYGQIAANCGSQLIKEEPQTFDDWGADLLVRTALLLMCLQSQA